ncbi:MAG: hypothetical protein VB934_02460, partial [Polyangiaceae bacterium]
VAGPEENGGHGQVHVYRFGDALGVACADGSSCASESCVDGVCCDQPCDEACLSCIPSTGVDEAIPSGTCRALPPGMPDVLCEAAAEEADEEACFDEQTQALGRICGSGGACEGVQYCEGFRCESAQGCLHECGTDAECVDGFVCRDERCEAQSTDVECDGNHMLTFPDGKTADCSPYRCDMAGTCPAKCSSSADCIDGQRCSASERCIQAATPSTVFTDCAYRPPGRRSSRWGSGLLLLLALCARRRLGG